MNPRTKKATARCPEDRPPAKESPRGITSQSVDSTANFRGTFLKVHGAHLAHNYRSLRQYGGPFFCPMIKANGYGHGDQHILTALRGEPGGFLGVSSVEEGLRASQHPSPFQYLVFGFSGTASVKAMVERRLVPVVSSFDQLDAMGQGTPDIVPSADPLEFHLKINTGMNRLGFQPHELSRVNEKIKSLKGWRLVGLGSHFHSGENLGQGLSSDQQLEVFEQCLPMFSDSPLKLHIHNSASLKASELRGKSLKYGIRPGLLFYGVHPSGLPGAEPLVRPVLSFHSKIVSTQRVKSGEVVSYGGRWTAPKDSIIGVVPAGYADGIPRSASNKGQMIINGKKIPIVGHVCMDYTMVDLTSLEISSEAFVGEPVVIFGNQGDCSITVEDWAGWANGTAWEILTGLSERVPRVYEDGTWESL